MSAYERWQKDYELPGLASSVGRPDAQARAAGADALLEFWNAATDSIVGRVDIARSEPR